MPPKVGGKGCGLTVSAPKTLHYANDLIYHFDARNGMKWFEAGVYMFIYNYVCKQVKSKNIEQ